MNPEGSELVQGSGEQRHIDSSAVRRQDGRRSPEIGVLEGCVERQDRQAVLVGGGEDGRIIADHTGKGNAVPQAFGIVSNPRAGG
jgi:hypothetical protein